MTKFEQGKEAIWEPNPGYYFFQKDGMPNYKRMIWRQIPESATRLSLVQRGDVHIAKQMLVREQEEAERGEGIQVPNMKTNFVVFGPLNVGFVPFDDKRVRHAFLYTIPYQEIINTVYKGRAERAFGVVWELVPGYFPNPYEKFVLDIDKAKALMAEAGLPDGFEFDFGYSLATPDMEEASILMRDSAAQAGIRMNLKGLTPSEMNDVHNAGAKGFPHIVRDFAIAQTANYITSGCSPRPTPPSTGPAGAPKARPSTRSLKPLFGGARRPATTTRRRRCRPGRTRRRFTQRRPPTSGPCTWRHRSSCAPTFRDTPGAPTPRSPTSGCASPPRRRRFRSAVPVAASLSQGTPQSFRRVPAVPPQSDRAPGAVSLPRRGLLGGGESAQRGATRAAAGRLRAGPRLLRR